MKKFFAVIAISAFLFSCGGNTDENNQTEEPATEQVAPTEDATEAPADTDAEAQPDSTANANEEAAPAPEAQEN